MAVEAASARFVRAIYQLAISTASLQERVGTAWLELMPLKRQDLPQSLQEAFATIESEMLNAPDDLTVLSEEAAAGSAERILRLAIELWGG